MDSTAKMNLMGGEVEVVIYDIPENAAGRFFKEIEFEALRLQRVFNLFDPASELSLLNRQRTIDASEELAEVVSLALPYCEASGGAYDLSHGRKFLARKTGGQLPETNCSYRDIAVEGGKISLLHPDVIVDLGSIAKGYVGDRIVGHMRRMGLRSGFVDARGDMRVFGRHVEVVRIQHPRDRGRMSNPFVLDDMACATSGDYNQYWGSYEESHLVGGGDFISATVAAPTLAEADALATCVFLAGWGGADELMGRFKEAKAYVFDREMKGQSYNGFDTMFLPEAEVGP